MKEVYVIVCKALYHFSFLHTIYVYAINAMDFLLPEYIFEKSPKLKNICIRIHPINYHANCHYILAIDP